MIYMKGVPDMPRCGFSSLAVRVLKEYRVPFSSRDILEDVELKNAVKAYRVLRQYGLRQTVPSMDTIPQPAMDVKGGTISSWFDYMCKMPRWVVTKDKHPQTITKYYVGWMLAKTPEEKLSARRGEAQSAGRAMVGVRPTVARKNVENGLSSAERTKTKGKGKRKVEAAEPRGAQPMVPRGVVFREPRPHQPKVKRSNIWVRTDRVEPSKFDKNKDSETSSTSAPMELEPKGPPKEDGSDATK